MAATSNSGFQWRPSTRVGLWATLASATIGLLLGLFQVQGWKVPRLLALVLIALLLALLGFAVGMILLEILGVIRRFLDHRATNVAWVESEIPGFLDYEADGNRAAKRFLRELVKLGNDTETLGKRLNRSSHRLTRLQHASGKREQRQAKRSAKSINRSAVFIEKRLALFRAIVKEIDRNYRGLVAMQVIESDADFQKMQAFRDGNESNRAASVGSRQSIAEYRDSVQGVRAQNAARTLRIATDRLGKALSGVVATLGDFEKSSEVIVQECDQKLREWRRTP